MEVRVNYCVATIIVTFLVTLAATGADRKTSSVLIDGRYSSAPTDDWIPLVKLYPVWVKIVSNTPSVKTEEDQIRNRDDFHISIGISKRQSRVRKLTTGNNERNKNKKSKISTKKFKAKTPPSKGAGRRPLPKKVKVTTPTRTTTTTTIRPTNFSKLRTALYSNSFIPHPSQLPLPSPNFPQPTPYTVTIIRKQPKQPKPESLILLKTSKSKNETNEGPPNIVYPPTGDTSELESEEEAEEEDEDEVNAAEDDKNKAVEDSSEEVAEEDQAGNESSSAEAANSESSKGSQSQESVESVTPSNSLPASKTPSNPTPSVSKLTLAPVKGDKGTIAVVQADTGKKKKKRKKKKKKRKKAQFHFVPKPLGPKADLMIRLDKVHHNVKNIASIVKGVFTDYVVNRPYVNVELHKKVHAYTYKKNIPHPLDRSGIGILFPDFLSRNNNNTDTTAISEEEEMVNTTNDDQILRKRILKESSHHRRLSKVTPRRNSRLGGKKRKKNGRYQLPYPIYMESLYDDSIEIDPFKNLPPMRSTDFMKLKNENNWVKTWDKMETGLPPIAGAKEASMSQRRRDKGGQKKSRRKKKHKNRKRVSH